MNGDADFRISREQAGAAADLLKGMANPNRLMILARLAHAEASVGEIEEELGIRQPSLSQQLAALRDAGLVEARREAKQVFYKLTDRNVDRICALLEQALGQPSKAPGSTRKAVRTPVSSCGGGAAVFARVIPFSDDGS